MKLIIVDKKILDFVTHSTGGKHPYCKKSNIKGEKCTCPLEEILKTVSKPVGVLMREDTENSMPAEDEDQIIMKGLE